MEEIVTNEEEKVELAEEEEIKRFVEKLELEPTATKMVGFVASRPSCQLVIKKFDKQKLNDQDTEQDSE
jgi:hypothetical protein